MAWQLRQPSFSALNVDNCRRLLALLSRRGGLSKCGRALMTTCVPELLKETGAMRIIEYYTGAAGAGVTL